MDIVCTDIVELMLLVVNSLTAVYKSYKTFHLEYCYRSGSACYRNIRVSFCYSLILYIGNRGGVKFIVCS